MKILTLILLACALLVGSGCVNGPQNSDLALVQRALDKLLPADFVGDVLAKHNNPYFKFTIRAGNVHRTATGWTFSWLVYERNGFSQGEIRLGEIPAGL